MKLNIENLGIIKQAEIDLGKKLTLFCGQNSTGKTYASYVLHAFLEDGNIFQLSCIEDIVGQILETNSFVVTKDYVNQWLTANCDSVVRQTGSIFGISETTKSKLFSKFSLSATYSDSDYEEAIKTKIDTNILDGTTYWKIVKEGNSDVVTIESNFGNENLKTPGSFRAAMLVCEILRTFVFCKMPSARMLTVERNSIYTFKTELSLSRNELIDQIQQSGKSEIDLFDMINRSSRRYPLAVRRSLKIANDLENVQKSDSPFACVADQIEKNLLSGEVSMTKSGDVEFHPQGMASSKKLPFHLSSSIVKTMASLVIYLRHLAAVGDTLIIDEPEMNFHPDVQILLTRIFAILSARGLHVVVSTHSDYIVREINNLIMAGALGKAGVLKDANIVEYSKEMLLNFEDVAVLYFKKTGKSVVRVLSLPVDEEGFAIESIDSTINDQNNMAERLYAHLMDIR